MEGILAGLFGVLGETAKYINNKALNAHNDAITSLNKSIDAEKAKGYNSDDAQIEAWYKELKLETDAFYRQLTLLNSVPKP